VKGGEVRGKRGLTKDEWVLEGNGRVRLLLERVVWWRGRGGEWEGVRSGGVVQEGGGGV